jgi:hypothetical protein
MEQLVMIIFGQHGLAWWLLDQCGLLTEWLLNGTWYPIS